MERTLVLTNSTRPKPANRLVSALPCEVLSSLLPQLQPVYLPRGRVLSDVDEPLRRVYFIEAGLISLVTVFEDGTTSEIVTLGREGVLGIGALLGSEHVLGRYVVAMAGCALAIDAPRFQGALRKSPELRAACEAYAQAFVSHLFQNVSCNAAHTVEQRCARWLLMSDDQAERDTFELAQDCLPGVLGVPPSRVDTVAGMLQREGLIQYGRGAIKVLDRPALEAVACKCYQTVRGGYERALVRGPLL